MKMDALRRRRRKQLREEMRDERGRERERERDGESDRRIAIHFVDILYAVIPLQYINSIKYQEYHGKEFSFYCYDFFKNIFYFKIY
jgi:hypothetical protein